MIDENRLVDRDRANSNEMKRNPRGVAQIPPSPFRATPSVSKFIEETFVGIQLDGLNRYAPLLVARL